MTKQRKRSKNKKKQESLLFRINKRRKVRRKRLIAKKLKKDVHNLSLIFKHINIDPLDQIIKNILIL